jgi:hypothetical protein
MNETAVFEGRRTSVSVDLRLAGIFMLGFGVACLGIGAYATQQVGESVCLAPGVLLSILGTACLIRARNRPNTRQVLVDGEGIRFIAEGRWQWGIRWTDLWALGTKRKADQLDVSPVVPIFLWHMKSGDKGLFFAFDNGMYKLRLGDDFGPEKTMKELFHHLARCAMQRNVPVEDGLGWGQGAGTLPRRGLNDRLLSTGVLSPPADLDPAGYQDRWHNGKNYQSSGLVIAVVFGVFGVGLIMTVLGISPYGISGLGVLGLFFTIFGLLLGLVFLIAVIRRVTVVAFNPNGLSVRGGLGKWVSLRWDQVRRLKLDVDTRQLTIHSDLGKRTGVLDEKVMLALCKMYTRATGRPAETWSSGAEAYFGVPARNLN